MLFNAFLVRNVLDMTAIWFTHKLQMLFFTLNVYYVKSFHRIINQPDDVNAETLIQG
jgi:hypothetical protein